MIEPLTDEELIALLTEIESKRALAVMRELERSET
jgi:hypothetical protein